VGLIVNKCLLEQVATLGNKRGAFRMLNICLQDTHQMGLGWQVTNIDS